VTNGLQPDQILKYLYIEDVEEYDLFNSLTAIGSGGGGNR
jgi:hypothetical protein